MINIAKKDTFETFIILLRLRLWRENRILLVQAHWQWMFFYWLKIEQILPFKFLINWKDSWVTDKREHQDGYSIYRLEHKIDKNLITQINYLKAVGLGQWPLPKKWPTLKRHCYLWVINKVFWFAHFIINGLVQPNSMHRGICGQVGQRVV